MVILLAGATGLVGSLWLRRALSDGRHETVISIGRRPSGLSHPRLQEYVVPTLTAEALADLDLPPCDAVVVCLGTTQKQAGSPAAFRAVDEVAVLAVLARGLALGATRAVVISAVGAHPMAWSFYSRVKGEVEQQAAAMPWTQLTLLQPSLLMGERAAHRPLEAWSARIIGPIAPLMRGALARYRPIPADQLAAALDKALQRSQPGVHRWSGESLFATAD